MSLEEVVDTFVRIDEKEQLSLLYWYIARACSGQYIWQQTGLRSSGHGGYLSSAHQELDASLQNKPPTVRCEKPLRNYMYRVTFSFTSLGFHGRIEVMPPCPPCKLLRPLVSTPAGKGGPKWWPPHERKVFPLCKPCFRCKSYWLQGLDTVYHLMQE